MGKTPKGIYAQLSTGFFDDPKMIKVGPLAQNLYLSALCYARQHLTDGLVDAAVLPRLGYALGEDVEAIAGRLVAVGAWDKVEDGYQFPEDAWAKWNPSAEQVAESQTARKEKGLLYAHNQHHEAKGIKKVGCHICYPDPPNDPTNDGGSTHGSTHATQHEATQGAPHGSELAEKRREEERRGEEYKTTAAACVDDLVPIEPILRKAAAAAAAAKKLNPPERIQDAAAWARGIAPKILTDQIHELRAWHQAHPEGDEFDIVLGCELVDRVGAAHIRAAQRKARGIVAEPVSA
jgi:hypothetical protein